MSEKPERVTALKRAEDTIEELKRENDELRGRVEALKSECDSQHIELNGLYEEDQRMCDRINELCQERDRLDKLIVRMLLKQEDLYDGDGRGART